MSVEDDEDFLLKKRFHLYNSIKVLTSFYKFKKDISEKNKNEKVILIDKKWFSKFKNFYLCDQLFRLIKENNISEFDPTINKILFNNLFNKFIVEKNTKFEIFYEGFPKLINIKNTNVQYVDNFEIINEEIYNNLKASIGEFNDFTPFEQNSFDYVSKKDKLIIKYNNKKENCFNLLIGHIDKDENNIYIPEILINFKEKEALKKEFENIYFEKDNFIQKCNQESNHQKKIEYSSLLDNDYNKNNNIKFFIYGYSILNAQIKNIEDSRNSDKNNNINIIKFFIKLFYEYKEINNLINQNSIQNKQFYLINKNFIDIYKNNYCYSELANILEKKVDINEFIKKHHNYDNLLKTIPDKLIEKINYTNKKNIIYNISHISLFSINYDYFKEALTINQEYLKIYKDFELWSNETYEMFLKIGFSKNNYLKQVKCYLGKKHLLIILKNNQYNQINICKLVNNYIFQTIIIIKPININNIIKKIEGGYFLENIANGNVKFDNSDDIIYFIGNKNSLKYKIIDILLFNEELFKKSKEKTSKYNEKQDNKTENRKKNNYLKKKLYLINENAFNNYLESISLKKFYYEIKRKIIDIYNKLPDKDKKGLKEYI